MRGTSAPQSMVVFVLMSSAVFAGGVDPDKIVVAGSSLEAPPPFWENSFWGINSSIDRAFPFVVQPFGPYEVSELQVPAYHYQGLGGSSADFSIHLEDAGSPGFEIATFHVSGISTVPVALTSLLSEPVLLESNERYWIVGSTSFGQVNWNLGDSVFGEAAYRLNDGEWQHLDYANVSAFALLGTPVPEPSTWTLLALSAIALYYRRKRSAFRNGRLG